MTAATSQVLTRCQAHHVFCTARCHNGPEKEVRRIRVTCHTVSNAGWDVRCIRAHRRWARTQAFYPRMHPSAVNRLGAPLPMGSHCQRPQRSRFPAQAAQTAPDHLGTSISWGSNQALTLYKAAEHSVRRWWRVSAHSEYWLCLSFWPRTWTKNGCLLLPVGG